MDINKKVKILRFGEHNNRRTLSIEEENKEYRNNYTTQ